MTASARMPPFAQWAGECPICKSKTIFSAKDAWFRDSLFCNSCPGGSIPRERATMVMIDRLVPNWRKLSVHESSPGARGLSVILARNCRKYTATQYFGDFDLGKIRNGVRNENLECQTFGDDAFDLVVTQDVMEHVFHPDIAYREIMRTLKPGGFHIHTTPVYKDLLKTECRATISNGVVTHLMDPEYHGNPIGDGRSLVTFHYGYDLPELISAWTGRSAEITRFSDPHRGLVAEFLDVIVCRKE